MTSGDWGTWWARVTPAPDGPPSTPTNFTASPDHAGPITLTWTAATGATGYDIFRKLSSDPSFPSTPLIQVGAVTTVQNINVDPGTQYDYAIRATNGLGASDLSAASTVIAATPTSVYQDSFATAGSFPGTDWNTTTAGSGAAWSQDTAPRRSARPARPRATRRRRTSGR